MEVFTPTEAPARLAEHEINRFGGWFTWSPEARGFCREWGRRMRDAGPPQRVRLLGGIPYDQTYSGASRQLDRELGERLARFAEALRGLEVPDELMLLTGMLDDEFDGPAIHSLLAYVRDALVRAEGDPMAALYSPIPTEEADGKEFLLHADLYLPGVLFNVYEEVPDDDSGASTFLPVPVFKRLLSGVRTLTEEARREMHRLLDEKHDEDHYETFFNLLHARENPWADELREALRENQLKVKLLYGQGYLVNDRRWLHGREAPARPGAAKRLHRLIFNAKT